MKNRSPLSQFAHNRGLTHEDLVGKFSNEGGKLVKISLLKNYYISGLKKELSIDQLLELDHNFTFTDSEWQLFGQQGERARILKFENFQERYFARDLAAVAEMAKASPTGVSLSYIHKMLRLIKINQPTE